MVYECLFHNCKFIVAKPEGWNWSKAERSLPFTMYKTESLIPADEDYTITVNGETIMASKIDGMLVLPETPVRPGLRT